VDVVKALWRALLGELHHLLRTVGAVHKDELRGRGPAYGVVGGQGRPHIWLTGELLG
jgi:hypothetical protein